MSAPVVIYDANVLFSASLRDFLVWLGIVGACRPHWTDTIHEEWIRNVLLERPGVQQKSLERCRDLMNANLPDSLVTGYELRIPTLSLPDDNDRHVLAAAIHAEASLIVTFNLSDFPEAVLKSHGIEAIHPDAFALRLFEESPDSVLLAAKRQRDLLKNPPKTSAEFLFTLQLVGLVETAEALHPFDDSI